MERRRKIFLIITKSNWGGAQRYVYDLATNLKKNKFEIVILLGGADLLKIKLDGDGIRTITIPHLERDVRIVDDIKVFSYLIKLFRTEHPDIVHLNSSKIGGLGALSARIAGVPKIIFTFHGLAFNEERGVIAKFFIKLAYWFTLFFCHQTIAVSNYIKEQVAGWPLVGNKIRLIYNGIGPINFLEKEEARQALLGEGQTPFLAEKGSDPFFWLGTIGELHQIKGQRYLIEALVDLKDPDIRCLIIGEGENRKKLEGLISERKLGDRVYLVGHKNNAANLLKAFDIFLLPSLSEGLAYVLLEAGAAALPVIASNVGGIPEIIDNLQSGLLVAPRRPDEIKNAILYLIDHPDEAKKFGQNLQKKVLEKFSLQRMISETEKLYLNP